MKKTLAIAITIFLFAFSTFKPIAYCQFPELVANFSLNVPTIDGMLGGSEWNDTIKDIVNLVNVSGPQEIETWIYSKHNTTHLFIGLVIWRYESGSLDQFTLFFDEGDDGSYGSGTHDSNLTSEQEDLKSWDTNAQDPLSDGYYDGAWYSYQAEIDFIAEGNHETDHPTSEDEIEYWEGLGWVDDHWECEYAIPLDGNDGAPTDVSDLNCTITDIIGIKLQYFIQPGQHNFYFPEGNQYQIQSFTNLSFEPKPTIESCNNTGIKQDFFNFSDPVFVNGSGYAPSTSYDIYVVNDTDWIDGMSIPTQVSGTTTTILSDTSGIVTPTSIWADPQTLGRYDIVVDLNGNGVYDEDIDPLDDNDIEVTAGFVIPEFQAFTIPMIFMMLALILTTLTKIRRKLT